MKDTFFSGRVYVGTYEPVYRFAEFGDASNYWIKLTYYVNRDDYQSVRQERGAALNLSLKNGDGEDVFGEVPAAHLAELEARNYTLGGQTATPANEEGDLFKVVETYVYAPSQTYTIYTDDVVPVWGINDPDYASKSSIVMGANAGVVYRNNFYNNTVFSVALPNLFKTGDYVMAQFECIYVYRFDFGMPRWRGVQVFTDPKRIVRISGLHIEVDGLATPILTVTSSADEYRAINQEEFYGFTQGGGYYNACGGSGFEYGFYCYARPKSGILMRAYSTREFARRIRPIREKVSFSMTAPTYPEIFIPKQGSGLEKNVISRETTMTPTAWKNKVVSGDWYQYAEAKPEYDSENGVYELRVRETQCI